MITYKFEAKCMWCGRKKTRAGVILAGRDLVTHWNSFMDDLTGLRWQVESKNRVGVLKCPGCMEKALKSPPK